MKKLIYKLLVLPLFVVGSMQIYAQTPSESQINSEYNDNIMGYLRQEVANTHAAINNEAKQYLVNLPNEEKLYDENYVIIKSNLVEGLKADGSKENNYVFEISYNCKHIEGVSDDYPSGAYMWNTSNSCRAICNLTQMFLEGRCKEYFRAGKEVTIRIHSTTDGEEISHINYNGEFGDFKYCPVVYNDESVRLSVNHNEGISNNAQLAYIRAQSVKAFLDDNVSTLGKTNNTYEFITKNYNTLGGHYRRSSIEIIVHGAFDETIEEMKNRLNNDDYIDFNIPVVEANSNPNSYVLIIANQDYSSPFPSVSYAGNDGEILQQYCIKTLGIPERHVKLIRNAGCQQIKDDGIHWLKDIITATKGQANLFIYYAGHAITDAEYNPYLIPNGIDVKNIKGLANNIGTNYTLSKSETKALLEQCVSLDSLCGWFNRLQYSGLTFIIDASFDGIQRNGRPLFNIKKNATKMRGMRIRNDLVIFNAANFDKTAFAFDDQHHGFLTYFILKEFKHNRGELTYQQLFNNIERQLTYESSLQNKLQEPIIIIGGKTKEAWAERSFR